MGQQAQRVSEEPLFHIRHGEGVGHGGVTLAELREANADDTDLLGWAEASRVGGSITLGGGAAPTCTVRRVA